MSEKIRTRKSFDELEALLADPRIPKILSVAINEILDDILSNERQKEITDAEYFIYQLLIHHLAGIPMPASSMFSYIGGEQDKMQAVRNLKERFDKKLANVSTDVTLERAPLAYQFVFHA